MTPPNWININKTFREFLNTGRFVPGLLIEVLVENKKKQFLIGDLNAFGCIAPGGRPFTDDALIIRYCVIWAR